MIRVTSEVDSKDERESFKAFEVTSNVQARDSKSPGWKLQVLD